MPIGWVRNAEGGRVRDAATERNTWIRQSFFEQIAQIATSITSEVLLVSHRALEAEIWTRWETASDEKVCPVCGPYTGHVWRRDEGPRPPLHPNCRCQRVYAFTRWNG